MELRYVTRSDDSRTDSFAGKEVGLDFIIRLRR